MKVYYVAVIGHSDSFIDPLTWIKQYLPDNTGIDHSFNVSFYPHNIEDTYLKEITYDLILVEDYTSLNEGVVTWKDEMSFEMTYI